MPVSILALTSVNTDHMEDLATYMAATEPLLKQAQAKIVARFEISQTLVGRHRPATLTLVQYPSEAATNRVFQSSEYGLLREARERAFSVYEIYRLNDNAFPEELLYMLENQNALTAIDDVAQS